MPAIHYSAYGVSFQNSVRLRGGGYRAYSAGSAAPKRSRKWLRHWLLMYSSSGIIRFPFTCWITLPEMESLCPYRLGVVRQFIVQRLRPRDFDEKHLDHLRVVYADDPVLFETLLQELIKQSLEYVTWYATIAKDQNTPIEEGAPGHQEGLFEMEPRS